MTARIAPISSGARLRPNATTRAIEVLDSFFQGLSDPMRVKILELLAEQPLTVTEIVDRLGLAQGRVSSHLSCLRWCRYVEARAEGGSNRYRLVDERVREILRLGVAITRTMPRASPRA
ncbi:MAG: metalloregulator ArsR/SmtB family transcription factor [Chloroflexi bacterium]|nr:metalloregulator ArsR/SmtB family transcription factor [Chloroflexota bacterium]